MIVWLNGALLDGAEARIDPADRGFTLGDGLFETMAVRNHEILRLDAHRVRLDQGCETLGLPFLTIDLKEAVLAVLAVNAISEAAIRLTLTRGIGPRGVTPISNTAPTLLIAAAGWPGAPPPARCVIASVTRRNEYSPLARIKSLSYLDNVLARQEAVARGANEAILLNTKGKVAETTVSNLFIVKHGKIFTPPVEDGALPGVMRAAVLAAYPCIETSLSADDVYTADGVFLTNSLGIRTLASLDGKPAGHTARAFMEDLRAKLAA